MLSTPEPNQREGRSQAALYRARSVLSGFAPTGGNEEAAAAREEAGQQPTVASGGGERKGGGEGSTHQAHKRQRQEPLLPLELESGALVVQKFVNHLRAT